MASFFLGACFMSACYPQRLPSNRHRLPTNRHRLPTNRHRLPTNRHRRAYWTLRFFFSITAPPAHLLPVDVLCAFLPQKGAC